MPYATLSIFILLFLFLYFFILCFIYIFFLHVLICIFVIVAFLCTYMYAYIFDLYLSVFLRSAVSVYCYLYAPGSKRVTQFQFSVCMYGTCGRIDNKADFDFFDFD